MSDFPSRNFRHFFIPTKLNGLSLSARFNLTEINPEDHAVLISINNKNDYDTKLMKGYVYLLTDGEYYKIGVTRGDIEKRIKKLQTGNPYDIVVVDYYCTKHPFKIEQMLHARHSHQRMKNEWFELPDNSVKNFRKECEKMEEIISSLQSNYFFNKKPEINCQTYQ